MAKVLVLDCETENAIQGKNEQRIPGIKYAEGGWSDYSGMGISCIGAWESWTDRYRVFAKPPKSDSLNEIKSDYPLTESIERAEFIVTFNGISFDGNLLLKHSVVIPSWKHIDLLVELRDKQGYDKYQKGFKLDDVALANGLPAKTGSGAHAPVLWQQGKYCEVIDYCLNDVWLLKELLERAVRGHLVHPKSMVHTVIDLPFKLITRPVQYQTELPAVADPIKNQKQTEIRLWDHSHPTVKANSENPLITKFVNDFAAKRSVGKLTDEDYLKYNEYFGDLIAPLPPHLRPENLN